MSLNTIPDIIDDIRAGKMVILMDDEDRENEGDIIMAATHVRPEDINFMITHARGLVCLTLSQARCQQLALPLMSDRNEAKFSTNFTVSIEAAEGVTTGISAADRARTIQAAVASSAKPSDIVQPGHIFPIMAQNGGVLPCGGDEPRVVPHVTAAARRHLLEQRAVQARHLVGERALLVRVEDRREARVGDDEVRDERGALGAIAEERERALDAAQHVRRDRGERVVGAVSVDAEADVGMEILEPHHHDHHLGDPFGPAPTVPQQLLLALVEAAVMDVDQEALPRRLDLQIGVEQRGREGGEQHEP